MKELNFKLDKEKCVKCGLCLKDCFSAVLGVDNDGYPKVLPDRCCMECQHCLAVCPNGAISIFGKNPEDSFLPEQIDSDKFFKFIANHRSCRHYKHENIDFDKMKNLKQILKITPTGCNFKNLYFSVVDDVSVMDSIREQLLSKLSILLKFIPARGVLKTLKPLIIAKNDVIFRNAPHMVVVSVNKKAPCKDFDPIIALSYFELYAQSLGIGTLWCGLGLGTIPLCRDIMRRLKIPKSHKIAGVMLFGNPDIKYARSTQPENTTIMSVK